MNKNWLKILVAVSAILIAGSAAFFSVTGLGVLFSGAAVAVMIMAGSLEFAKLVTATYLKQEWESIKGINKWYLTTAVVILMAITSAGIFGYLSNAFQQQNIKLDQVQREINVWNNKIEYTNQQIATLQGQQKDLTTTQNTLISKGNVNNRLLKSVDNRDKQSSSINKKINSLQDSIVAYNAHINDIKNNNIGIEREVGGFRFVAEAFGVELKSVVKFFIILIVVVFDPLAVALIIAFNALVLDKKKEEKTIFQKELEDFAEGYDEKTYDEEKINASDLVAEVSRLRLSDEDLKKIEDALLNPQPPNENLKEAAENYNDLVKETEPFGEMMIREDNARMDIIGQNGNEGLHYEEEVINQTPISREETEIILGKIVQSNQNMGLYEEPLDNPMIKEKPLDWEPTISDNFTIGPDGAYEREDEEISIIEPTEEEEVENFSTIEPNTENIFQDNFTESEISEEISENVKQDEVEITEEDIIENLNNFETETFSKEPTTLNIPPLPEDTTPFVQLPETEESSIPNEEDEKKN